MAVLGEDVRRPSTPEEVAAMCDLLRECIDAGAVGMSTSYVDIEEDFQPVPCRWAEHSELEALCAVLGERGRMLQIVHEFFDAGLTVSRVEMLGRLSRDVRHPHHALAAVPQRRRAARERPSDGRGRPREWAAGGRVWPQVQTRPIDISWTLDQRSIMFLVIPGWWQVLSLADEGREARGARRPDDPREVGRLSQHARERSRTQVSTPKNFVIRDVALETNRDLVGRTLGEQPRSAARTPAELFVDLSVEEDLGTWFMRADIGHNDGDAVGGLLAHPYVHVGASDGGAHVGSFATYGDTGYSMSRYVRDTGSLRLEEAVKKITSDPCTIWDLPDRGLLKEGYIADVAVFDADTIDRGPEVASDDFPGDGIRWIRRSVGMDTVLVGGGVAWDKTEGYVDAARAGGLATR